MRSVPPPAFGGLCRPEVGVPSRRANLTVWTPALPYRSSNAATPIPPLTQSVAIP